MKLHRLILISFIICSLNGFGQKDADEILHIDPYTEIIVSDGIKVYLIHTDQRQPEVRIISGRLDDEELKIIQKGRSLRISLANLFIYETDVELEITYNELYSINAKSGATIELQDTLVADQVEVKAGGGSQLSCQLFAKELTVKASEGAEIYLVGKSEYTEYQAHTAGKVHAYELVSYMAYAKINTGAKADINVSKEVDAQISTGGKLEIYGNPESEYIRSGLGGSVARKY